MRRFECPHELEVVAAARNWPAADPDLRAHVPRCGVCSDLVEVAEAITTDRRALDSEARLQPAAVVYWRSQRRARREASLRAARPVVAFQALAAACLVGVGLALAGLMTGREWLAGLWDDWSRAAALGVGDNAFGLANSPLGAVVVVVVAAAVLSIPLAIYLIFSDR